MTIDRAAKDRLKSFVERIERLEEEKKSIADDIKDVYAEAKANGFDTKALREVIKLRKLDVEERKEQEAILETYKHALGMTPIEAAVEAAGGAPGSGHKPIDDATIRRVASAPAVRAAIKRLGTPTELTEEERANGYGAALIGKDGNRILIGHGSGRAPPEPKPQPVGAAVTPPDQLEIPPYLGRRPRKIESS